MSYHPKIPPQDIRKEFDELEKSSITLGDIIPVY